MIDVIAALEVLSDVVTLEKDASRAVADAKTTYGFYASPASVTAAIKAGKLSSITGPLARTLTLADKLANDPERAPHLNTLIQSLVPSN